MPSDAVIRMMGLTKTPLPEVETDAQAASTANKLLDDGVDAVKLFLSTQSGVALRQSTVQAAIAAVHGRGKRAFAHPNNAADVLCALQAGVDVIAHTTPQFVWDPPLLALIAQRRPALTPTLALWKFFMRHDRASIQDRIALAAAAQLRQWVDAGGTVLFGTDAGAVETDPTAEYELMAAAGMTFRQILAALTTAPAEQFGESRCLGKVTPGYRADVVVVKGEPEGDIRALSDVQYTLRAGSIVYAKRGEV